MGPGFKLYKGKIYTKTEWAEACELRAELKDIKKEIIKTAKAQGLTPVRIRSRTHLLTPEELRDREELHALLLQRDGTLKLTPKKKAENNGFLSPSTAFPKRPRVPKK